MGSRLSRQAQGYGATGTVELLDERVLPTPMPTCYSDASPIPEYEQELEHPGKPPLSWDRRAPAR